MITSGAVPNAQMSSLPGNVRQIETRWPLELSWLGSSMRHNLASSGSFMLLSLVQCIQIFTALSRRLILVSVLVSFALPAGAQTVTPPAGRQFDTLVEAVSLQRLGYCWTQ